MMELHSRSWSDETFGDCRALVADFEDVRLVFGIGPPTKSLDPVIRMEALLAALRPEVTSLRWGQQIHGHLVASIASEPARKLGGAACVGRCDALITAEAGIGLVIWSADCVPLLFSGDGVVAAVHSGWRGAAADISAAIVDRFRLEYGVPSGRLQVALGPAISGSCYEVGQEVIAGLSRHGVDESLWLDHGSVDLRSFLVHRLQALGIEASNIELVGGCTLSTPELASFRRDGERAGRQWSLIYRPSPTI